MTDEVTATGRHLEISKHEFGHPFGELKGGPFELRQMEMKQRVVLCNDPEMTLMPANIPKETFKLRIEKTAIRRVPGEAFCLLSKLEFLWMPYNSIISLSLLTFKGLINLQELRLDGNDLSSFPWEALAAMPQLRLLDLCNNKLSLIPKEAAQYLKSITYLDLSSNKLITLPNELITTWLNFQADPYISGDYSRLILGLQDNPWVCDCRLYDMVHFLNAQSPSITFIEPRLKCFAPQSLSAILFSHVELRKCQRPELHMSMANMNATLGSTVLLRCGTTGVPIPELSWRRANGVHINGTVHQEISSDGISWSILGLLVVSSHDSGKYFCKAKNFLGTTEDFIFLIVTDSDSSYTSNFNSNSKKLRAGKGNAMEVAAYNDKLISRFVISSTTTPSMAGRPIHVSAEQNPVLQHYKINDSGEPLNNEEQKRNSNTGMREKEDHKSLGSLLLNPPTGQPDTECLVRALKVIGDTDHSISLAWKAPPTKNVTSFNILYAIFGEKDMHRINVEPRKTKITIDGLMPKTKYIACVCMKGLIPRKEQCIIFSTDEAASAGGTQKLINLVVISVACVIAVPLTLVVCCGELKRHCKKCLGRKSKNIQDSYVMFKSLSPGTKTEGMEVEYLTSQTPDESNRLLSAWSSVYSEAISKMEGQPNEFFC
ncbi:leucine-rich repeat, immunoglobulin-like domain and transmembrane domain-containing protein 1 [Rhinatrema bivittatum]|uniref:leucine-rich repeat, immunoglobulin-like domain and transmembrane domain-containing protein 1 n=1 Tax=Rhinatrema bivittatum TaxID=194408 RepID=UPI00112C0646|nr:leucine-rich repeat, immunoglobulin-like domain and transmembrane domain-containing protein 1 [Rhinatrema bivittatum]